MKPGWKTSEFWHTNALHVLTAFVVSDALPAGHWSVKLAAFLLSALAQVGYTAGRAYTKAAALKAPPG